MRSIPHRVVCLLGLDDGSFPRHIERDGDDLSAQEPRVGDRDARNEDRQLLLDALLAAREHLVITYTGRDERSNLPRPPAVPIGELLDVIDRTARTERGSARGAVVVTHPLQPFDPKNYERGRLVAGGPWSFDTLHLAGARAASSRRPALPPFLPGPLGDGAAADGGEVVPLDALERFTRHPVRAFLRQRLGVSLWNRARDPEDAIPLEIDGLAQWEIGERMLAARVAGSDWARCEAAESVRGGLPPAALAEPLLADMYESIEALLDAARTLGPPGEDEAPSPVHVAVDLAGLPSVVGTVAGVRGDVVRTMTYRRIQPALRLASWLRLLVVTAAQPERPFEAVTVCRSERGSTRLVALSRLGPLGPDAPTRRATAEAHLADLVRLYLRGMREPLPLYCATSAAYASASHSGREDAEAIAAKKWESGFNFSGEDDDGAHVLVLGSRVSFAEMLALAGRADAGDPCGGWEIVEGSRFGVLARALWDGLLHYERLAQR
jgi:exodeoxyribonuclease V gamma subunit